MLGCTYFKSVPILSLYVSAIKERCSMGKHCKYCRCSKVPPKTLYPCQHCGMMCKRTNNRVIFCSIKCRLLGSSENSGECILWKGNITRDGYGKLMAFGKKDQRAHRVAYTVFKGEIPSPFIVRHSCDIKECINPDHLLLGTVQENSNDFGARHGHFNGERIPTSKLNESKVKEIRELYKNGDSQQLIANKFNVSQHLISCIVRKKLWSHV